MIDREIAQNKGIKMIESSQVLTEGKQKLIERLKAILPNVINADNQLDIKALQDVVDSKHTTSNNQGYELTFAGKGIARAMADKPTDVELKTEIKQSKHFDDTENVLIRGDNLEVLKILQANYHKKIKMIYIDPPYNTKSENFIYKDNFKKSDEDLINRFSLNEEAVDFLHNVYGTRTHSGWLSFIYPRLKLARELLTDDGVIFISIDDNEQANLKILCDEIFGEDNFVACLPTIMNLKGNNDEFGFAGTHEFTLVYGKQKQKTTLNHFIISDDELEEWQEDELGFYKQGANLKATGVNAPREKRSNLYFPIFIDSENNIYLTENNNPPDKYRGNLVTLYPVTNSQEMSWRWSKSKFLKEKSNVIVSRNGNVGIYKKQRPALGDMPSKKPKTIFYKPEYSSGNGTSEVKNLLNNRVFNNPKPVNLLKDFIQLSVNDSDTILDFFAGSGTTADAVMQLNAEDGGNRKFILVQLDEPIDQKKSAEAHKFCTDNNFQPVISSITLERLNRAGEKIKTDFEQNQKGLFDDKKLPDIGYKVFSCTQKPQVAKLDSIFKVENRRTDILDTLVNMLVATCKTLDTKIECLIENKLYKADREIYLLSSIDNEELEKYQEYKINLDGWADIDLTQYLNLGVGKSDNISVIY
ncbi:MAG: site-specific DNA-methyltransferase [Gammaproteobacteria bacterium]|nr:site-specific DNA-methyltransferase [Gammaproteobacteria bacterium]